MRLEINADYDDVAWVYTVRAVGHENCQDDGIILKTSDVDKVHQELLKAGYRVVDPEEGDATYFKESEKRIYVDWCGQESDKAFFYTEE